MWRWSQASPAGTIEQAGAGLFPLHCCGLSLHTCRTACRCTGLTCATACREGRYNLDPDIEFFATPPVHGSLAEVRSSLFLFPTFLKRSLRPAKIA